MIYSRLRQLLPSSSSYHQRTYLIDFSSPHDHPSFREHLRRSKGQTNVLFSFPTSEIVCYCSKLLKMSIVDKQLQIVFFFALTEDIFLLARRRTHTRTRARIGFLLLVLPLLTSLNYFSLSLSRSVFRVHA